MMGVPAIVEGWKFVLARGKVIDPKDEYDWADLSLGFCLALAHSIPEAFRAHEKICQEGLL